MYQIKRAGFILVMFLIASQVSAQSKKTSKADKLFDRFKFQEAITVYKKLVRSDRKDRKYIYQKLGDAYSTISKPEEAVKWYEKAVKYPDIDPIYYYKYAMSLRENKAYQESIDWMKKYKKKSGMSDTRLQEFFKELDIVKKVKKDGVKAHLYNMNINSPYTEYGGTYYKDHKIVYTTNNIKAIGKKMSSWDNMPFTDLKVAFLDDENYVKAADLPGEINTDLHESSPCFNNDFTVMYFTRNNLKPGKRKKVLDYNLKLYRSFFVDGQWQKPTEVHFNSNSFNCAHPCLSKDNKTLYFVSDMPGTYGKSDIYKVAVNPDWTLGEPENMGNKINTEGTETFPFIDSHDNLYFSSDGHAGLGGLDIFVAFYSKNNFIMLKNMGLPYNSSKDDFAFAIKDTDDEGFISSNRLGGNGSDDIYRFTTKNKIRPLVYFIGHTKTTKGDIIPNATVRLYENGKLVDTGISNENGMFTFLFYPDEQHTLEASNKGFETSKIDLKDAVIKNATIRKDIVLKKVINMNLLGCVVDLKTLQPIDSTEVSIYNITENNRNIVYTNKKCYFTYHIPKEKINTNASFELEFRKKGYLPQRLIVTKFLDKNGDYWIKPNKETVKLIRLELKPIYFNLNKANIRPDAAKELDKIVTLLQSYPHLKLSMESHTDARSSNEYNLDLSERRAKSTMQYLIDHGINPSRLKAKGFGETRLVNNCSDGVKCTEAEHQMNRRTEFMVIGL